MMTVQPSASLSSAVSSRTPGPWRYREAGRIGYVVCGDIFVLAEIRFPEGEEHGQPIAGGFGHEEANARLMAAAPDLLAALRSARASLAYLVVGRQADAEVAEYAKRIAEIDAAIAKAEGRP
jgi:hypothetical protein